MSESSDLIQSLPFSGKLIEHVAAPLTHSMFLLCYKPTYQEKWSGSCLVDSLEKLRQDYSWVWESGHEIRIYELQLPTGASPLNDKCAAAGGERKDHE